MRADDDIDLAVLDHLMNLLTLTGRPKAVQQFEPNRKRGESLLEVSEVLLTQDSRRTQHGDLAAVLGYLERGADGDLRLAEADISADESVHRPSLVKVRLRLPDRLKLARSLDPRERRLHLRLPRSVRAERAALHLLPLSVQLDEPLGKLARLLPSLTHRPLPVASREAVDLRLYVARVEILLDPIQLVSRNEQLVRRLILDEQVLPLDAVHRSLDQSLKDSYSEIDVDDVVTRLQVENRRDRNALVEPLLRKTQSPDTEEFLVGEESNLLVRQDPATGEISADEIEARTGGVGWFSGHEVDLAQNGPCPRRLIGGDRHVESGLEPRAQGTGQGVRPAPIGFERGRVPVLLVGRRNPRRRLAHRSHGQRPLARPEMLGGKHEVVSGALENLAALVPGPQGLAEFVLRALGDRFEFERFVEHEQAGLEQVDRAVRIGMKKGTVQVQPIEKDSRFEGFCVCFDGCLEASGGLGIEGGRFHRESPVEHLGVARWGEAVVAESGRICKQRFSARRERELGRIAY